MKVCPEGRHAEVRAVRRLHAAVDVAGDREQLVPGGVPPELDPRSVTSRREAPKPPDAALHLAADDQAILVPARRVAVLLTRLVDDAAVECTDGLVLIRGNAAGIALDVRPEVPADAERPERWRQRRRIDGSPRASRRGHC